MSNTEDDRFVQEVSEELRRDQMKDAWRKFGPIVIGVAIFIVVATAGYQAYKYRQISIAGQNGDDFSSAIALIDEGKADEGFAALEAITTNGTPAYAALANLRLGNAKANADDMDAALAAFEAVSGDKAAPEFLRDLAKLRVGQLMVDSASLDEVTAHLQALANDASPYRFSASEAIALSAYKAGEYEEAQTRFEQILSTVGAPNGVLQRSNIMLELMKSKGLLAK